MSSSTVRASSVAEWGNRRLPNQTSSETATHKPSEESASNSAEKDVHATESDVVWEHNAWDMVKPPPSHVEHVSEQIAKHRESPVSELRRNKVLENAGGMWDAFYGVNENKFFKDRQWLRIEFPELFEHGPGKRIWEVGCGVGNTVFPLVKEFPEPGSLFVYACDFAQTAIDIIHATPEYDEKRICAFVYDLTDVELPRQIAPESLDVITCIFCLSAIPPTHHKHIISTFYKLLKKGGVLLFRDYGRGDLTQIRFKKERWLGEDWYIRGDGTQVYFFTPEILQSLFDDAEWQKMAVAEDTRMLVNRKERKKMFRVWLQAKFRKL